jgi:hypothetical protein
LRTKQLPVWFCIWSLLHRVVCMCHTNADVTQSTLGNCCLVAVIVAAVLHS